MGGSFVLVGHSGIRFLLNIPKRRRISTNENRFRNGTFIITRYPLRRVHVLFISNNRSHPHGNEQRERRNNAVGGVYKKKYTFL